MRPLETYEWSDRRRKSLVLPAITVPRLFQADKGSTAKTTNGPVRWDCPLHEGHLKLLSIDEGGNPTLYGREKQFLGPAGSGLPLTVRRAEQTDKYGTKGLCDGGPLGFRLFRKGIY